MLMHAIKAAPEFYWWSSFAVKSVVKKTCAAKDCRRTLADVAK